MDDALPMPKRQKRAWFGWWIALLALSFIVTGVTTTWHQWNNQQADLHRYQQLMDPAAPDPGVTAAEITPTDKAVKVSVGAYIERIPELSIKGATWTAVLDLWFRWEGDGPSPGENFVIMEGAIESKEKLAEDHTAGRHYERYRVVARITHPFSVTSFPYDQQLLSIAVENGSVDRSRMLFVPDLVSTSVSSRATVPGYRTVGWKAIEKPHSYKTTRGDPRLPPGMKSTYSQFRLGITLHRDGWGLYFKMFQALFVAVGIAILAGFIKPTHVDPRFGLGVGGLFAAVANSYLIGGYVPDTGEMVLADVINGLGILAILVTLIESTVSLHLYDSRGEEELSRRLDHTSLAIMLLGFIGNNVALLVAANWP
ncbi:MAG: hypothetical protein ACOYMN_11325 [Roseimicrobium sp.]